MRDRRGAQQARPEPRQIVLAHLHFDRAIALDEVRENRFGVVGGGEEFDLRPPESDVVDHPDIGTRDERERRDMLEPAHRDQREEPVLSPPMENHVPAARLDAERGRFPHDTRRMFLRRFHACTGRWSPNRPIVTALPSPPPSNWFSIASQMWLYWFFSGSSE